MFFQRIDPPKSLCRIVECYWIVENDDPSPAKQKIIPDGFTELIFHYGDLYRIAIDGQWSTQTRTLFAGQIDKHFYLENTGRACIFGIKLKPAAMTQLFGLDMKPFTNVVAGLESVEHIAIKGLSDILISTASHTDKIAAANDFFQAQLDQQEAESPIDRAIQKIMTDHGMVSVTEMAAIVKVGERQVENLFKKYIGLSPKLYARIVRFSYIFELIREQQTWSDLAYKAAFYDQSHFIRNFKAFTGENPADYSFDNRSMANFFLLKNEFKR